MPDATRPGPSTLRSPFVARLVAHAMLDALMQWMEGTGVVASPATLASAEALRREIDRRVGDAEAALRSPHGRLPATLQEARRTHPLAQAVLDELHLLDERLEQMRVTLMHCQSPGADPGQGSLPFDDPSA